MTDPSIIRLRSLLKPPEFVKKDFASSQQPHAVIHGGHTNENGSIPINTETSTVAR